MECFCLVSCFTAHVRERGNPVDTSCSGSREAVCTVCVCRCVCARVYGRVALWGVGCGSTANSTTGSRSGSQGNLLDNAWQLKISTSTPQYLTHTFVFTLPFPQAMASGAFWLIVRLIYAQSLALVGNSGLGYVALQSFILSDSSTAFHYLRSFWQKDLLVYLYVCMRFGNKLQMFPLHTGWGLWGGSASC